MIREKSMNSARLRMSGQVRSPADSWETPQTPLAEPPQSSRAAVQLAAITRMRRAGSRSLTEMVGLRPPGVISAKAYPRPASAMAYPYRNHVRIRQDSPLLRTPRPVSRTPRTKSAGTICKSIRVWGMEILEGSRRLREEVPPEPLHIGPVRRLL